MLLKPTERFIMQIDTNNGLQLSTTNQRWKFGTGLQLRHRTTGLWHTILAVYNDDDEMVGVAVEPTGES